MPGKGRAVAYSDFYKNRVKTPEEDKEVITPSKRAPVPMSKRAASTDKEDRRKAALKRKLAALREGK